MLVEKHMKVTSFISASFNIVTVHLNFPAHSIDFPLFTRV